VNSSTPDRLPGRIALVGSGEYLPAMEPIEAWLIDGRPPRFVQLATAAAPEGDRVLDRWHAVGAAAAQRLGVEQVIVDVRRREDADEAQHVEAITGAGLIYLSGGNPSHLAKTLRGSRVWDAIWRAWRLGASVAGCSAGAMALCGYIPGFRHPRKGGEEGLGLIPDLRVIPHFDKYAAHLPDLALRPLVTPGATVVGIDEETALIADSASTPEWSFVSRGTGSTWRIDSDRRHRVNSALTLRVG